MGHLTEQVKMNLKLKPSVNYASGMLAHADENYLMDSFFFFRKLGIRFQFLIIRKDKDVLKGNF